MSEEKPASSGEGDPTKPDTSLRRIMKEKVEPKGEQAQDKKEP